ncbi:MAG: class I SAM-dependent methyltransferase [Eubacteriales bacterium]|nr:class I SAM-dependent methyltransferase [Eubacteriales bacterium]
MSSKIKLSERMQTIADHIREDDRTADIGTDHGYIPIYLISSGITDRVILTDINEGPLTKAAANFEHYLPGFKPDLRIGDGLSAVSPGEADDIIIAGMGGILISKILARGSETASKAGMLILQPRNHSSSLRHFLRNNENFTIVSEEIAVEDRRFCEIITAKRTGLLNSREKETESIVKELEKKLGFSEKIYDELPVMYALTGKYRDYLDYKCRLEQLVIDNINENGRSAHAEAGKKRAEERLSAFSEIRKAAGHK